MALAAKKVDAMGMAPSSRPPTKAPATEPMPPTTASMVTGSDAGSEKSSAMKVRPASAPPAPAMAAESANTPTLVEVRLSPRVAHATGESFMAASRRPHDVAAQHHQQVADERERARRTARAGGSRCVISTGPNVERRAPGLLPPGMTSVWLKNIDVQNRANAAVASAR